MGAGFRSTRNPLATFTAPGFRMVTHRIHLLVMAPVKAASRLDAIVCLLDEIGSALT